MVEVLPATRTAFLRGSSHGSEAAAATGNTHFLRRGKLLIFKDRSVSVLIDDSRWGGTSRYSKSSAPGGFSFPGSYERLGDGSAIRAVHDSRLELVAKAFNF